MTKIIIEGDDSVFFDGGIKIYKLINLHLKVVGKCLNVFGEFLQTVLNEGITDNSIRLGKEIETLESEADENRREIIKALLNGALLPDSRREILKLIEYVDKIANDAEEVTKQILLQEINFPTELKEHLKEIYNEEIKQFEILSKAINNLFTNIKDMKANYELLKAIESMESDVDDIENMVIKKLYKMDILLAEKNQLKDIISAISDISDLIEDISDIIEIILAIRKV